MNKANSKAQNDHIRNSAIDRMRGAISNGRPSIDAIRRFRTTPDYYYGGKVCRHKADKPCNPGCLLWADCQQERSSHDGE